MDAALFVAIFSSIFAIPSKEQIKDAREKRIAEYRKSPESRMLKLND